MELITDPNAASTWTAEQRHQGRSVGFVPTMGALHDGHISLITKAKSQHRAVACSVFVNPLQFNNAEDLARYPRQLDADMELLNASGCDLLFAPNEEAIYAGHSVRNYDTGGLDTILEGASRPGHFQGVVNVVERLFHYVRPDAAYFGEKDRQQLTILKTVAETLRWPVAIVPCPTQREVDGLAMSSRNQRLSPSERKQAAILYKALIRATVVAFDLSPQDTKQEGVEILASEPGVRPDYFAIVDTVTLQPLTVWGDRSEAIALVAAQVGPVRLIDNMLLHR